jgi:hypothetical protein
MRWAGGIALVAALSSQAGCKSRWPFNASDKAIPQMVASATQQEAGAAGLLTFQKLVTPQNFARLGFTSLEDVQRARLGDPMVVYRIDLEALRRFRPGSSADELLVDNRRVFFPIEVDAKVVTSLTVTHHNDGWRPTDFGNAAVARVVGAFRRDRGDFLVHVPALNDYFVGRRSDSRLTLVPIMTDPRLGFKAGEPPALEILLSAMQRAVADYNGLPQ